MFLVLLSFMEPKQDIEKRMNIEVATLPIVLLNYKLLQDYRM